MEANDLSCSAGVRAQDFTCPDEVSLCPEVAALREELDTLSADLLAMKQYIFKPSPPPPPPTSPPLPPPPFSQTHFVTERLTRFEPYFNEWGSGAFSDGEYSYFVPSDQGPTVPGEYKIYGKLLRVANAAYGQSLPPDEAMQVLDLETIDYRYTGFTSGFAHGDYIYLVPGAYRTDKTNPRVTRHGFLIRVSRADFSPSGVEVLNVETGASGFENAYGFANAVVRGDTAYLIPGNAHSPTVTGHSTFVRVDLNTFAASDLVAMGQNLHDKEAQLGSKYAGGATSVGDYIYAVTKYYYTCAGCSPRQGGYILRMIRWQHGATLSASSAQAVDLENVLDHSMTIALWGLFSDGTRYLYAVPYTGSKVYRIDTDGLTDLASLTSARVTSLDLAAYDDTFASDSSTYSQISSCSFMDGQYAYYTRGKAYGKVFRVRLSDFASADVVDFEALQDAQMTSFRGTYTDGDFGYTIPVAHGQVAKFPVTPHTPQQSWSSCFEP